MARIRFYGGVGVIGGSRIAVEESGYRVLLDLGQSFRPGGGLARWPASYRPERELADRLRLGDAPAIEGLYRSDLLDGTGLAPGPDARTAVFVSHPHIDHAGLTAFVDPAVPVYAAPSAARLEAALAASGEAVAGERAAYRALDAQSPVAVGPLTVRRLDIDHDVPGASGYLVETAHGRLAYTGDFRMHGRHPERTRAFAEAARGVDVLVIEGTTLGQAGDARVRTEDQVDVAFAGALAATPGLVLLALYPRNLERVEAFSDLARSAGREILWPAGAAAFLREMGMPAAQGWDEVGLGQVARDPSRYVVTLRPMHLPHLLDLPTGPSARFVHANGEPLGPFDPAWGLLSEWLGHLGVPLSVIGTGGHATPDDLAWLVTAIRPKSVYPIHTLAPERLLPGPEGIRRVAHYDRWYPLAPDGLAEPATDA